MRLLFTLLLAPILAAPQDNPVFRANVSLVHLDAEVISGEGRVISGLTKADFRILDERKEQPIVQFSSDEESLDLILLFDVSGSMQRVVQQVAAAAHQGLRELRPGDRVAVRIFNNRSREVAEFTEDLDAVARIIQRTVLQRVFGGGTLIQKAVAEAAVRFRKEPRSQRRRAVLIITDNIGTKTERDDDVVKELWESDAILSGLIVNNRSYKALRAATIILAPQTIGRHAGMTGIAAKSGGDAIGSEEPAQAFQEAMHRIRARYSLYYQQPAGTPGETHAIHVELTREAAKRFPKARVRARTGYVAQ